MNFDFKKHTIAKLHEIIDDMYYEYACGYVHYLNIINNMKEKNEMSPDVIEAMKHQMTIFTHDKDMSICKKHDLTPLFLEEWIHKERYD